MLKNQSKDLMYLLRILESIGKINLYTSNLEDFEKFYEDDEQKTFNATLTLFGNIGERASKMSEELRINYGEVPWQKMKDFRNKIAHEYETLEEQIIFDLIKNELPQLKKSIEVIISENLASEKFSREEYEVCLTHRYYRHVDFKNII